MRRDVVPFPVINFDFMISSYERSDLIHIMRINHFALNESDSARLDFNGQLKNAGDQMTILILENLPRLSLKQNGATVFNETFQSIDDLKIFLEERLYQYLSK